MPERRQAVIACRPAWSSPDSEHPRLRPSWFGGWGAPGGRPARAWCRAHHSIPRGAIRPKTRPRDQAPQTRWRIGDGGEAAWWWSWRRAPWRSAPNGLASAAARPGVAIWINDVIEQIIARDNLEPAVSMLARIPAPPTPQRAGLSGLNAYLSPYCRRVDSSDEDEPQRPVWPPCRPHLEFDDGDYEQLEDTESKPVRHRISARRPANLFIDAETDEDGDMSSDKETDDVNDNFNNDIVADDVYY